MQMCPDLENFSVGKCTKSSKFLWKFLKGCSVLIQCIQGSP